MTLAHLGCSRFRAVSTPFWTVSRHCLATKGLQIAHFAVWDQKGGSRKGRKQVFSKMALDPLGCSNTHSKPVWKLVVAIVRLRLAPTPLKYPIGGSKGVERGQQCVFLQVTLTTPQDAQTHVLGRFGTPKGSKLPGKTLRYVSTLMPSSARSQCQIRVRGRV